MLKGYDIIRIVSLFERTDRRKAITREFRKHGFIGKKQNLPTSDNRMAFFDAYRVADAGPFRSPGSHGAYLSHLEILHEAAKKNQSVLIFQDDCSFCSDIVAYQLPTDCDVFYGGWMVEHPADEHNLQNAHIIGAHFMGFSPKAAKLAAAYLTDLLDPNFPPDPEAAIQPNFNPKLRPPIDGALVWFRRAYPELKVVFNKLGEQRCSATDIGNRSRLDDYAILAPLVGILREFKHRNAMIRPRTGATTSRGELADAINSRRKTIKILAKDE